MLNNNKELKIENYDSEILRTIKREIVYNFTYTPNEEENDG